ncbi:MAG: hypothetical protein ACUBOA_11450 [Candidatus Loosdrechtia sp.]|uniref:hypothetical protein n=1 Tax=Candidatus Loosdrechtia sp. TaxID=3101272 RepID=UPI003A77BDE0|nr:MAG: hypothetical protein QY305_00255 [Candidatus Jettenia sp. AMX2]
MRKDGDFLILTGSIGLFVCINIFLMASGKLPFSFNGFGIMLGAGLTLAVYSFLYKDNPSFKIAENLYVGVSLGYTIIITWFNFLKPDLFDPLIVPMFSKAAEKSPHYTLIIPSFLGIFMLLRFSRNLAWLSRWTFAFVVGLGAGISIPRVISAFILGQIKPSLRPVFSSGETILSSIDTLLILLGVTSVLIYFIFSVEHKGAIGKISKVGIWFLMISFGASFGYTVMARVSLLIGRVQFLLRDWLGILQ